MIKELFAKFSNDSINDCIIFMTNYSITKLHGKGLQIKKDKVKYNDIMKKYHINALISDSYICIDNIKIKYEKSHDSESQNTFFKFDESVESLDDESKEKFDQLYWTIKLFHSLKTLLDTQLINLGLFFSMESFLISKNDRVFQVDPIIYTLNGDIFILYELVDYSTGEPLKHSDIYGRDNNYNICKVDWYQFFGGEKAVKSTKISDVIFSNIADFLSDISNKKYQINEYTFVHNLLVFSNSISNVKDYFLNVLGSSNIEMVIKNINTSSTYKYYTESYMGVATDISKDDYDTTLYDLIVLESLKTNIYLNSIISLDIEEKLSKTINRKVYFEAILASPNTPIITVNLMQQIRNQEAYKQHKESLDYKINYLNYLQEKNKSKNATLLNILIYIMTFIGGIGTLEVLDNEFGLPFKYSFIFLLTIYIILGIIWAYLDYKE